MSKTLQKIEFHTKTWETRVTDMEDQRSRSLNCKPLVKMLAAFFSLILLLGISSEKGYSQTTNSGLETSELSKVVQVILDAPELQKYYPIDSDNSVKQINIVQYPFSFPSDLSVSKGGKAINFVSNSELSQSKPEAYFMFRRVDASANSAKLVFHYFYKVSEQSSKILSGVVDLQKSGSNWSITNANLGGDK